MCVRKKIYYFFFAVLAFVVLFSQRSAISRNGNSLITIKPRSYIVSQDNIIDFDVEIESESTDLQAISIKPETKSGLASIYNRKNDTWVGQNSPWTGIPEINGLIRVKIVGIDKSTQLKFNIQNKQDGKIYETDEVTIYGREVLEKYTNKINANLSAFEVGRLESEAVQKIMDDGADEISFNSQPDSAEEMPKKYLIIYAVIFLASVGTGFVVHRHKSKYSKMT